MSLSPLSSPSGTDVTALGGSALSNGPHERSSGDSTVSSGRPKSAPELDPRQAASKVGLWQRITSPQASILTALIAAIIALGTLLVQGNQNYRLEKQKAADQSALGHEQLESQLVLHALSQPTPEQQLAQLRSLVDLGFLEDREGRFTAIQPGADLRSLLGIADPSGTDEIEQLNQFCDHQYGPAFRAAEGLPSRCTSSSGEERTVDLRQFCEWKDGLGTQPVFDSKTLKLICIPPK